MVGIATMIHVIVLLNKTVLKLMPEVVLKTLKSGIFEILNKMIKKSVDFIIISLQWVS